MLNRFCQILLITSVLALLGCSQADKNAAVQVNRSVSSSAASSQASVQLSEPQCHETVGRKLIISEIVAKSDHSDFYGGSDWIEFYNQGDEPLCLSQFQLQIGMGPKLMLPDHMLKAGQYDVVAITELRKQFPDIDPPVALKRHGEIKLLHKSEAVHGLQWQRGDVKKGRSFGVYLGEQHSLYPTPGYANVPYQLFNNHSVIKVKIHLPIDAYKHLMRNPTREDWYKGELEFNGAVVKNVAVSTKGSSSLRRIAHLRSSDRSYGRYSFKIDFNKYQEQKFMGMKRLVFNNGFGDPTLMRDNIAYRMMKLVGMPAPEFAYVDLWFAERHLGLYQMIEPIDGEFVEKYFPDDDRSGQKGDLYKAFSSLQLHSDDTLQTFTRGRYPALKLITNEETQNTPIEGKALMAFLASINSGSAEQIDVDLMTRYIAAMTLISNYDSYFANVGNYFLYEHRSKHQFTMLPWDFNLSLGRSVSSLRECKDAEVFINHPTIVPLAERPMIARVLENPEWRKQYHDHIRQLIAQFFNPQAMRAYVESQKKLIEPVVKNDHTGFARYEVWLASFNQTTLGLNDGFSEAGPLLPFVDARSENVLRQLNGDIPSGDVHSGPCAR